MSNKNLLILTSTFPRWKDDSGKPPFVYELSKRLASDDISIFVLAPHAPQAKKYEEIDNLKIHRYQYLPEKMETLTGEGGIPSYLAKNKLNYLKLPFLFIAQSIAILKIVKKEHIRVIHAHWLIPQGLLAVLCKKIFNLKVRIIVTSHGSDIFSFRNAFCMQLKKFVLKHIDHGVVVSHSMTTEILELSKFTNTLVIPMGVDQNQFKPENYSPDIKKEFYIEGPFILFVGRLSQEKGILELLNAFPDVIQRFPNLKLLVIGDGPLKERAQDVCAALHLEHHVVFRGALPQALLPAYYATADILVGPSEREGFGLVFAEALASGCSVIAADLPTTADIIINEKTGLTVNPKDSASISRQIIRLIEDKELRQHLAEEGRKHVLSKFTWDIVCHKYKEILLSKK